MKAEEGTNEPIDKDLNALFGIVSALVDHLIETGVMTKPRFVQKLESLQMAATAMGNRDRSEGMRKYIEMLSKPAA